MGRNLKKKLRMEWEGIYMKVNWEWNCKARLEPFPKVGSDRNPSSSPV